MIRRVTKRKGKRHKRSKKDEREAKKRETKKTKLKYRKTQKKIHILAILNKCVQKCFILFFKKM